MFHFLIENVPIEANSIPSNLVINIIRITAHILEFFAAY